MINLLRRENASPQNNPQAQGATGPGTCSGVVEPFGSVEDFMGRGTFSVQSFSRMFVRGALRRERLLHHLFADIICKAKTLSLDHSFLTGCLFA